MYLLISYFSNPRGAAHSRGPLFDLEVFYFLVSIKKLEGSPCSSLSEGTLFQSPDPLFFFQIGAGLRNGKSEHQPIPASLLLLPFMASQRGFLSPRWFFVCLSLSVSTV